MRVTLLVLGLVMAAGAALLVANGQTLPSVMVLGFYGIVLAISAVVERVKYRPGASGRGRWQPTGERFVDPTSGKMTEVLYNPDTGERNYVEVD